MSTSFDAVVAALWRSLELEPPSGAGSRRLRIDGRSVTVAAAPNGTELVISARVGALAPSGPGRTAQLRTLLREGLGTVLTNRAGLRLAEGSATQVEVVALGPCRTDAVPRLREAIEDLLQLLDIHAPTLDAAGRPSRSEGEAGFSLSDTMIFRL